MKKILYLLSLALLILPLSIMAKERVIELNVAGQSPLNQDDQRGFVDEVVTEAFRRIGYQLKTVRLPAERGLVNANRGIIDGEIMRVKGIDRLYKNLRRVPEKIMDWEFVGFSYQPPSLVNGWEDLAGKSVSHINGWKIYEKNIPASAEVTKTQDAVSLFNLLMKKRTDIALYERWGGLHLLQEMSMEGVQLCGQPLAVKEMFTYLHKKHQSLVVPLAKALSEMKQDGTYEALFNKHLMPLKKHDIKEDRVE